MPMRGANESEATASDGDMAARTAALPRNGSKYRRNETGKRDVICCANRCLLPIHFKSWPRGGARSGLSVVVNNANCEVDCKANPQD